MQVKTNWQVFPVDSRGIDFVGYVFYHTHTLLRKSIKKKISYLLLRYQRNELDLDTLYRKMSSYFGWLKYCNSKHYLYKIEFISGINFSNWDVTKTYVKNVYLSKIIHIEPHTKYFKVYIIYGGTPYYIISRNKKLIDKLYDRTRRISSNA